MEILDTRIADVVTVGQLLAAAAILVVLTVVVRLLKGGPAVEDAHRARMQCASCGWSGLVSRHKSRCASCGGTVLTPLPPGRR